MNGTGWNTEGRRYPAPACEAAALPCAGGVCWGARGKTPWLPVQPVASWWVSEEKRERKNRFWGIRASRFSAMVTPEAAVSAARTTTVCARNAGKSVLCAGVRRNAREFAFTNKGSRPNLRKERIDPFSGEDCVVAKRKGSGVGSVRVVLQPSETMPTYDPAKPDARLSDFVRLLARQAARKFVEAERERASRDHLPD